jgi:hypothetical protein
MGRNTEVARECAGYRLAEHREAGRPRTPHALCQALQRTGDRDKSSRDFDAPEYGVVGRDQKIAAQSEFESPSEGDAPYSRDRRHAQNLKSAVGSIHLSNEGAEPIDVLAWPLAHFAAKAEVLPFRRDHQRPYIAATCFVDRVSQTMREL